MSRSSSELVAELLPGTSRDARKKSPTSQRDYSHLRPATQLTSQPLEFQLTEPLTIIDLFCGTGGFSKGFEDAGGFDVVLGVDLLPHAIETFRSNHAGAAAIATDIRGYDPSRATQDLDIERGAIDIIIGGPPCQGFSSIRPNRGSERYDPRNDLFVDFARYVEHFRPRMFVLENVVGLATHGRGATLELMQETFNSVGYDTDWKVLNAAQYGVPQKRERLIMIGSERGGPLSFPSPSHGGANLGSTIGVRDRARMHGSELQDSFLQLAHIAPSRVMPIVTVADAIDDLPSVKSGEEATSYDRPPRTEFQADRRRGSDQLKLHRSTRHTDKMMEIIRHSGPNISHIPKHLISSGFSSCYSRLAADEPSVTITVNFVHPASNRCIHPTLDRALTPREGARLQSFDDDFKFQGSRAQIVKQIGNAVPPLLGRAIGGHIAQLLGSSHKVLVEV
jgi:DNA (cytosine-5)-methyltransferase 1